MRYRILLKVAPIRLAAVVIPNVARFIGSGKSEAASTELANVQTSVVAWMADAKIGSLTDNVTIAGGAITGGTTTYNGKSLANYFTGGIGKIHGSYTVSSVDGSVTQTAYP